MNSIGTHITLDVYYCNADSLAYVNTVKELLNSIVDVLDLSKVNESYKQFEPIGVTGFILLEESHVSIHTWPEHKFAAVDIFSCKSFNISHIQQLLKDHLETTKISVKQIERGVSIFAHT